MAEHTYLLGSVTISDESRKELLDYHKWIISLAALFLSVSIALVGFLKCIHYPWIVGSGWLGLFLVVFLNWMVVKHLVTLRLVCDIQTDAKEQLTKSRLGLSRYVLFFSVMQNWIFLWAGILLLTGFTMPYIGFLEMESFFKQRFSIHVLVRRSSGTFHVDFA